MGKEEIGAPLKTPAWDAMKGKAVQDNIWLKCLYVQIKLPVHLALGDSIHPLYVETYRTGTSGVWHTPEPRDIHRPLHLGMASRFGVQCVYRIASISHLCLFHMSRDFPQLLFLGLRPQFYRTCSSFWEAI